MCPVCSPMSVGQGPCPPVGGWNSWVAFRRSSLVPGKPVDHRRAIGGAYLPRQRFETGAKPVVGNRPKAGVHFLGERLLALLRPVASPPLLDFALAKHHRSEERRVGKGCVSTCRSGGSPNP